MASLGLVGYPLPAMYRRWIDTETMSLGWQLHVPYHYQYIPLLKITESINFNIMVRSNEAIFACI